MNEQWIVVEGSLSDGVSCAYGPFASEDDAYEWIDSSNVEEYAVVKLFGKDAK